MGRIRDLIQSHREKTREYRALRKGMEDLLKGTVPPFALSSGQGLKPDFSKQELLKHNKGWAYTCSQRNAVAVAKATLRLYATRATGQQIAGKQYGRPVGRPITRKQHAHLDKIKWIAESPRYKAAAEVEEIMEHPFMDLMRNVNPHRNQFDLMMLLSLFMDNTGDAYWHIVTGDINGRTVPVELWTLPSQLVTILPDPKTFIKGYKYGKPMNEVTFPPEAVIHFLRPDMKSTYYGMSRIEGAWWAVAGTESYEKYAAYITENMGIKDMLIKYKGGALDHKRRRDLMAQWSEALRVAGKMRQPLIGDEDFDIEEASWSPKEIGFLKSRELRKPEIIAAYGQTEGMYDKAANVANINGAIYQWEEYEITSTLRLIEQKLNEKLLPLYGEDRLVVAFDSVVADDKEFVLKQQESDLTHYITSVNETRVSRGLDTVPWGDVPLAATTIMPLGSTSVTGTDAEEDRIALRSLPAARSTKTASPGGVSHVITVKADDTVDVTLTGGENPPMTRRQQKLANEVKPVFAAQMTLAVREVEKFDLASFEWVASDTWAEEIAALARGSIGEFIELGGVRGAEQIGVNLIDFIERPSVQSYIDGHSFRFAKAVGNSSEAQLRAALSAGLKNGESIPQLQARMKDIFTGWADYRTERIARYESSRALTAGTDLQWQESGVVAQKVWDANGDACPFCLSMDGQETDLGGDFWPLGAEQVVEFEGKQIKLSHNYEAVIGGDLHPNCRCSIRAKLIET